MFDKEPMPKKRDRITPEERAMIDEWIARHGVTKVPFGVCSKAGKRRIASL